MKNSSLSRTADSTGFILTAQLMLSVATLAYSLYLLAALNLHVNKLLHPAYCVIRIIKIVE